MSEADRFISQREQDEPTAQESTNRERAGAGTSSRSQKATSNDDYTNQRHNSTDRRTDPAEACSWREVYHAMGVPQPDNES